ncbi:MAG: hypothetical protein ACTSPY_15020, partial [Candidatus Helarchaeota archaeon]
IGNYLVNISFTSPSGIYTNATLENVPFRIRRLKTNIDFDPIPTIPWGNNCTISIYYRVQDSESDYHDGEFLAYQTLSITNPGWTLGVNYTYNAYATNYTIEIDNATINAIGSYSISVVINTTNNVYENGSFIGIPFTVRALQTTITYDPVPPIPYGNNGTCVLYYFVQDSESLFHNGEFISGENINITSPVGWTTPTNYTYIANPTNYTLTIVNESILSVGIHYISVEISSSQGQYESATFTNIPIQVRALTTSLTYSAVVPVPYGNNASITLYYKVSDPQSWFYDGVVIPDGEITITSPTGWVYSYTNNYPNNYTLNIDNSSIPLVQDYSISVKANSSSGIYADASISALPFTVRPLATNLFYDAVPDTAWGNPVPITIRYLVKDPSSLYHNNELVPGANITVSSPSGWTVPANYSVSEYSSYYILTVDNDTTVFNQGTYYSCLI